MCSSNIMGSNPGRAHLRVVQSALANERTLASHHPTHNNMNYPTIKGERPWQPKAENLKRVQEGTWGCNSERPKELLIVAFSSAVNCGSRR